MILEIILVTIIRWLFPDESTKTKYLKSDNHDGNE